jgi:hypothetical protein
LYLISKLKANSLRIIAVCVLAVSVFISSCAPHGKYNGTYVYKSKTDMIQVTISGTRWVSIVTQFTKSTSHKGYIEDDVLFEESNIKSDIVSPIGSIKDGVVSYYNRTLSKR